MYNRTNERFLAFERKQLDQMRRILSILTSDQQKFLSGKNKSLYFLLITCGSSGGCSRSG